MPLLASNVAVMLGGRAVVRDVSLRLQPGKVTGLLGPNGAGKSTLMRALAGQLDHAGTITLDGNPVRSMADAERARHIAWLPQAREASWALSVASLVALGRLPWHGWRRSRGAADQQVCDNAMQLMQVSGLAARPVTELSGGELARVLLARAIAQDTPVLLADEPAAGLDPAHQMSMMAVLRQLSGHGRSILVSLHDLSLAARWCDELVLMRDGGVAASGTPGDVMTAGILRDVYGINAEIGHDECGLVACATWPDARRSDTMNGWINDMSAALQMLADKGGPTMIALGILSVCVVAVFIGRALALLFQGKGGMTARLAQAARAAATDANARSRLEQLAVQEAARLRSGFRFMDLAATAAPLLGLLGTVLGMIEAFRQLEAAGSRVNPSLLAGGIWEALLTTAAGMVVALVALVCLSVLESLAERISLRSEQQVNAILADGGARP